MVILLNSMILPAECLRIIIEDGYTIEDGHPSFCQDMTNPLIAQEFTNSLIRTEYCKGRVLPDMSGLF